MFPLEPEQREKIITFVLGLVADPPAEEFVYQPQSRRQPSWLGVGYWKNTIAAAAISLRRKNGSCSSNRVNSVRLRTPSTIRSWRASFRQAELDAVEDDRLDARRADGDVIEGVPAISNEDGTRPWCSTKKGDEIDPEEEYDPDTLLYPFEPWKSLRLGGQTLRSGFPPPRDSRHRIRKK